MKEPQQNDNWKRDKEAYRDEIDRLKQEVERLKSQQTALVERAYKAGANRVLTWGTWRGTHYTANETIIQDGLTEFLKSLSLESPEVKDFENQKAKADYWSMAYRTTLSELERAIPIVLLEEALQNPSYSGAYEEIKTLVTEAKEKLDTLNKVEEKENNG